MKVMRLKLIAFMIDCDVN